MPCVHHTVAPLAGAGGGYDGRRSPRVSLLFHLGQARRESDARLVLPPATFTCACTLPMHRLVRPFHMAGCSLRRWRKRRCADSTPILDLCVYLTHAFINIPVIHLICIYLCTFTYAYAYAPIPILYLHLYPYLHLYLYLYAHTYSTPMPCVYSIAMLSYTTPPPGAQ